MRIRDYKNIKCPLCKRDFIKSSYFDSNYYGVSIGTTSTTPADTLFVAGAGHITASGDISASGDLSITGKSFFGGHITASGNISASGINYQLGDLFKIDGTALYFGQSDYLKNKI